MLLHAFPKEKERGNFVMARNRVKNREKVKEEKLNSRNEFSISDPTPMIAVNNIIDHQNYIELYKYTDENIKLEGMW